MYLYYIFFNKGRQYYGEDMLKFLELTSTCLLHSTVYFKKLVNFHTSVLDHPKRALYCFIVRRQRSNVVQGCVHMARAKLPHDMGVINKVNLSLFSFLPLTLTAFISKS